MKASELIQKLQEEIELHGDREVLLKCLVDDYYGWNGYRAYYKCDTIDFVDFSKKHECIYIESL